MVLMVETSKDTIQRIDKGQKIIILMSVFIAIYFERIMDEIFL